MDGDNLKLKYIIKKSIRIQMRQCSEPTPKS